MDFLEGLSPSLEPSSVLESEDHINSPELRVTSITTRLLDLAITVDHFYTPLICLFGTVGNCLSIIVFLMKPQKSSSIYLCGLTLSDTGYLINLFILWLDNMGLGMLATTVTCKIVMYLGQLTGFLSVWFIVIFTVERFFAVCYPLFKPSHCTASRAKKISIGLAIFAAIMFSYVLIIAEVVMFEVHRENQGTNNEGEIMTSGYSRKHNYYNYTDDAFYNMQRDYFSGTTEETETLREVTSSGPHSWDNVKDTHENSVPINGESAVLVCSVPEKYHNISEMYSYADSILTFIVPFVLISILNMKIIFCVKKIQGKRTGMLALSNVSRRQQSRDSRRRVSGPNRKRPEPQDLFTALPAIRKSAGSRGNSGEKEVSYCSTSNCGNGETTKERRMLPNQGSGSIESDNQSSPGQVTPPLTRSTQKTCPNATEMRVTKTLLLVSTVFLLLHLPSHSIRAAVFIEQSIVNGKSTKTLRTLIVAQHWANLLFNTNFAINFLLYCCSGKAFRHSVKNIFSKEFFAKRRTWNRTNASTTVLTTQLTLNTEALSVRYNTRVMQRPSGAGIDEDQI